MSAVRRAAAARSATALATSTASPIGGDVRRRRASLLAAMLLVGIGMASWVTRTPDVRDAVEATTAQMGLILFGLSIGSMAGVLSAGPLVRRIGTRPVIASGLGLVIAGVAVIAASTAAGTAAGVFAGLALFGLGTGLGEIGLNIEGAEVERLLGKPLLPMLHGFFSLGTVIGAVVGIVLTRFDFPAPWHLAIVSVLLLGMALWAIPGVPRGTGITATRRERRDGGRRDGRRPSVWRDRTVLLIGIIVLAMAFAEGAANDWLPLLMVDGHGTTATVASLVYAGFAAMMTVGRLVGGPIVARFGRPAVLRVSAVMAIIGTLGVAFAPHIIVAGVAVALWGLGASLGFPVAISAAGDDPERSAERVSAVATSGYLAFLVGPPLLGVLGEFAGLQYAMLVVVALLTVAVIAATKLTSSLDMKNHPDQPQEAS